jgi:hypothetical protein
MAKLVVLVVAVLVKVDTPQELLALELRVRDLMEVQVYQAELNAVVVVVVLAKLEILMAAQKVAMV